MGQVRASIIGYGIERGNVLAVEVRPPSEENPITVYCTASLPHVTSPSWSRTVPLCSTKPIIAQQTGNTYNAESSLVAVTHNAGRTWQRVTFAVPAQVPGGMQGDSFLEIGQIECPQADACVAIGVSDQGSTSTPIYTNHG